MKIKVFSFNENTKQGKINIKFSPKIVENIEVEYSYQIVDSKINFLNESEVKLNLKISKLTNLVSQKKK